MEMRHGFLKCRLVDLLPKRGFMGVGIFKVQVSGPFTKARLHMGGCVCGGGGGGGGAMMSGESIEHPFHWHSQL